MKDGNRTYKFNDVDFAWFFFYFDIFKHKIMNLFIFLIFSFILPLEWRFLTPLCSVRNDTSDLTIEEAETILARESSLLPISPQNSPCHSERQRGISPNVIDNCYS